MKALDPVMKPIGARLNWMTSSRTGSGVRSGSVYTNHICLTGESANTYVCESFLVWECVNKRQTKIKHYVVFFSHMWLSGKG